MDIIFDRIIVGTWPGIPNRLY